MGASPCLVDVNAINNLNCLSGANHFACLFYRNSTSIKNPRQTDLAGVLSQRLLIMCDGLNRGVNDCDFFSLGWLAVWE